MLDENVVSELAFRLTLARHQIAINRVITRAIPWSGARCEEQNRCCPVDTILAGAAEDPISTINGCRKEGGKLTSQRDVLDGKVVDVILL